jgi:hypothetical protein
MLENQGINNQIDFAASNQLVYQPDYKATEPIDVEGFRYKYNPKSERNKSSIQKVIEMQQMDKNEIKNSLGGKKRVVHPNDRRAYNPIVPASKHFIETQ